MTVKFYSGWHVSPRLINVAMLVSGRPWSRLTGAAAAKRCDLANGLSDCNR